VSKNRKPTAADKASRYTDQMAASQGASVSEPFQSAKTPITAFNVKLPTAPHPALKMRAVEEHTTMSDLLRKALEHTYGFPYNPYQ